LTTKTKLVVCKKKLKFYACNFKQAFYSFHNDKSRDLYNTGRQTLCVNAAC